MKILLINGSPREGNTARVLEALAVRLGGHELETLRLGELGIRGCIGCLSCQQDVEHFVCHQTGDDANAVLAKIVAADVVLMATPLYGHCFTAQMKCLDDRMSALVKWVGGEHPHVVSALKDKPMGLAVTCGGPSAGNADLLLALFDKIAEGRQARVFGKYVFEFCPGDPAGFTPDEEVGRGVDHFDVAAFGADFAYTVDGGMEGELEYENFNAASAKVEIQGRNVHPGYAKNKMINAIDVACELQGLLPASQRPQFTEGYEGFYHCVGLNGTVENASVSYIIRDHDAEKFEQKKVFMWAAVDLLKKKYGDQVVTLTLKDQYYNMRKMVEPHPQVIDKALKAMEMAGVKPLVRPIRGGTDGARLSFMGLPCPNLFTGGMNFHGKFEYCSLTTMRKAQQVILNLAVLWSE